MTTGWAARTTTPPTGRPASRRSGPTPTSSSRSAPTGPSWPAPCATWPGEAGIRQFLDIGTGIPTANNTHEVAQSVAPGCRVVYVDNDPVVLAHARALLVSSPQGVTSYIDADLRDTGTILAQAAQTLDFSRPIAVMLMAILQHIDDAGDPYAIVAELLDAVPPGSYLALSHPAADIEAEAMGEMAQRLNQLMAEKVTFRGQAEVARFFDGLDMVDAGNGAGPAMAARHRNRGQQPGSPVGRGGTQTLTRTRGPHRGGAPRSADLPARCGTGRPSPARPRAV